MEELSSNADTRLPDSQVAADSSQHQVSPSKSSKSIKQKAQEQNESIRRGARSFARKVEALVKCKTDLIDSLETDYVARTEHDELKKQLEIAPLISQAEHKELKTSLEQSQEQSKKLKLSNDELERAEVQSKLELEKASAEIESLSTLVGELQRQLKEAKAAKKHAINRMLKSIFTEIGDSDDEQVSEITSLTTRPKATNTEEDHQMDDIPLVEDVQDTSKEADLNVVASSLDNSDAKTPSLSAEHEQNLPGDPTHGPLPTPEQGDLAATDYDENKDQDVSMDMSLSSSTMVEPQAQRTSPLVDQEDAQSDQMCDADSTATQFKPSTPRETARAILSDATITKRASGLFGGRFGTPPDADSVFGQLNPVTKTFGSRLSLSRSPDNSFPQSTHRSSSALPRLIVRLPISIQVDNILPPTSPADLSTKLLSVSHDNTDVPEKYKLFNRPLSTKRHLEDRMWENARSLEQEIQRRRTKADLEKQLAKQSSAQAARAILASIPGFSQSPDFVPFDIPSSDSRAKTSAIPPMKRLQNSFDEHDHGPTTPTGSLILRLEDYTHLDIPSSPQDQAQRRTSPIDLDTTKSTHEQAQWQRAVQDATTPNEPSRLKAPSSPRSSRPTKRQAGSQGSNAATLSLGAMTGTQPSELLANLTTPLSLYMPTTMARAPKAKQPAGLVFVNIGHPDETKTSEFREKVARTAMINRTREAAPATTTKAPFKSSKPATSKAAAAAATSTKAGTSSSSPTPPPQHTGSTARLRRSPSLEVVRDRQVIPEVKSTAASTLHSSPKTIIKSEPDTQTPWVLTQTNQSFSLKRKYNAVCDPRSKSVQSKRRYDATYDPRSDLQAHTENDDAARDPKRLSDISTRPSVVPDSPPKPASGTRTPHFSSPHFSYYAPSYPPWSSKWSFTSWNGKP